MPLVDDIWYVGRTRAEDAHGDLDGSQRSTEVKWGKLCAMATIFGQKKPWCKLRMMMTLMEVKGHQRSNGVNYVLWLPYLVKRSPDASWEWWWPWWRSKVIRGQMGQTICYGYHIWSKEALMQAENHDDLDGGQRSSEVKWGKLCAMATIFGQKKRWCKVRMMIVLMEVKGHQRSNGVKRAMATIFSQKKRWCKVRMMMTLMEVKGHQRSNGVNYMLWLPYLVKRSTDASWESWWPWWRSKVIRGQMG